MFVLATIKDTVKVGLSYVGAFTEYCTLPCVVTHVDAVVAALASTSAPIFS